MGRRPFALQAFGLAAASLFLALFLLWPLAESLRGAFVDADGKLTFAYVVELFRNPVYLEGLVNALAVGAISTVLATAIGFGVAFVLDRFSFRGKSALAALVPLPLIVPPFVGAIGIKQIFGQGGALNALLVGMGMMDADHPIDWLRAGRFWAVVALIALHLYPIVYFNVSAALGSLDAELEEAAESLGASGARKLFRVTLPLVGPSVFAGVALVFIAAFTELGVPIMCDFTRITSVQIFSGLKDIGRNPFVYALVAAVLAFTVALYALARLAFGSPHLTGASKGTGRTRARPLRGGRALVCGLFVGGTIAAAALPNVAVVLVAFARDWYGTVLPSRWTLAHFDAALGHALVVPSIANSLRYVSFATALDLGLGIAVARMVVRSRYGVAKALDAAAMLPLAIPGLVMAFGYLAVSREGRPLAFLNPVRDPTALLVIAYSVRRLPFVVRGAAAGLEQIGGTLEEAARSLGASPFRAFRRVTLPLLVPHLLAGGIFAFALSMLEVSDSLILAQRQATFPITKAIYELFQLLGDGRSVAAALGVWVMVFLGVSVVLARSLLGRRWGAMFRF